MKQHILYLYNSDGRKLEAFAPRAGNTVRLYCCGPTVYSYAHIGNLRAYTVQDILRRCLLALGYELKHVMNITDVGHLSDDGDEGEDKMLLSAQAKGKSVAAIARHYTEAFFYDCAQLRIAKPEYICRATDYIAQMQEWIAQIESAGYTYYRGGNLYFDTAKLSDYGRLIGPMPQRARSRTGTDSAKKNQRDFVLWFSKGKFADQALQWDSPWGRGYPGWHIECSAMAGHFLGDQIDIHCGGVDHKTVHHPNEMAQSESILPPEQKPWVRFWLHNEFVVIKSDALESHVSEVSPNNFAGNSTENSDAKSAKISKSSGGALTLNELQKRGFSALDYRYFLLGSHYRSQIQFHFSALQGAQNGRRRLHQKAIELQNFCTKEYGDSAQVAEKRQADGLEAPHMQNFLGALLQDLNTPQALAALWNTVNDESLNPEEKLAVLEFGESILQIGLLEPQNERDEQSEHEEQRDKLSEPLQQLVKRREEARSKKNYALADELRREIESAGYQVVDAPQGGSVLKKRAASGKSPE